MPSVYAAAEAVGKTRVWMAADQEQLLRMTERDEIDIRGAKVYRISHPIDCTYGTQKPSRRGAHAYVDLWGRIDATNAAIDTADYRDWSDRYVDGYEPDWIRVPFVV